MEEFIRPFEDYADLLYKSDLEIVLVTTINPHITSNQTLLAEMKYDILIETKYRPLNRCESKNSIFFTDLLKIIL